MAERPEAIFFDVGNTLLFPNWTRILGPLTERGIVPTHEQLQSVERRTKNEFDEMVASGRPDLGFWRVFLPRLLELVALVARGRVARRQVPIPPIANWD